MKWDEILIEFYYNSLSVLVLHFHICTIVLGYVISRVNCSTVNHDRFPATKRDRSFVPPTPTIAQGPFILRPLDSGKMLFLFFSVTEHDCKTCEPVLEVLENIDDEAEAAGLSSFDSMGTGSKQGYFIFLPPAVNVMKLRCCQCDQIWRFFGLWASFWSLWQQLICPNLPSFLGNFCKGAKIYHFYSEIIFRQLLLTFGDFYLVTLDVAHDLIWGLQWQLL